MFTFHFDSNGAIVVLVVLSRAMQSLCNNPLWSTRLTSHSILLLPSCARNAKTVWASSHKCYYIARHADR